MSRRSRRRKSAQLEAFYRAQLRSGKMGLVLVGPIQDGTGARKKGILKSRETLRLEGAPEERATLLQARRSKPPLRESLRFLLLRCPFDVKTPTLSVSFRVPDLDHEDTPALDLLAGILGMGELSRLYQKLFYQTSIATELRVGFIRPRDPGMLYFQAEMDFAGQGPTCVARKCSRSSGFATKGRLPRSSLGSS